ncbi:MAG: hypothetical protein OEU32_08615 [Acidimicrobiia bacterium]|nr:hypothetical protein [Acidimicrobiia bacterium]
MQTLRLLVLLPPLAVFVMACSSAAVTSSSAPALPGFCEWADAIEAAVPPVPEPVEADVPLDIDRLVTISNSLTAFAGTLESAAAFAPEADQTSFTELASFNREVASVITSSGDLRDEVTDSAADAADRVVDTLADECDVVIEPAATLAFVAR